MQSCTHTHMAHWGGFEATSDGVKLTDVRPLPDDPDPVALIGNVASAQHHRTRIDQPYIRRGWLDDGPGPCGTRGTDEFVAVSWDEANRLLGNELTRVYREHGPQSVFGGSYGWASAGRLHHAQSQVHRFLNCLGGYTSSVNNYSYGASQVLLPHVVGSVDAVMAGATSWQDIAENTDLFVAFGGLPLKNTAVSPGGLRNHKMRGWIEAIRERGTNFVLVSPLQDDAPESAEVDWIAARPGTDAAIMLGLGHVLLTEGLIDRQFVDKYCEGFEKFEKYVLGQSDGIPKDPDWAESISEVPAKRIVELARQMAGGRTMVAVSWSLQRSQHGEQPIWLAVVLGAMLGQIGLPGGGFGHGYGSTGYIGEPALDVVVPAFPQGTNPVREYIPVARIADMLLYPGETYDYNGEVLTYPDIRLVYWAGGNPFHHAQDLARLHRSFGRPDTVVVHDSFWTASAREADIVLPATMTIERNDFAAGKNDSSLVAMPALTKPAGQARDDFTIFCGLAEQLGIGEQFSHGRDEMGWLRKLYDDLLINLERDHPAWPRPDFDEFWRDGFLDLPIKDANQRLFAQFREDPDAHRLATPSGRIEVWSSTIDSFGYDDCLGHPAWIEPDEWLGADIATEFPLHLIANQPKSKLHSQLDVGDHSQSFKVHGREPIRLHPTEAAARRLVEGDLVRVSSPRGFCLAGLAIDDRVRPGVAQLSTGAWYDPDPVDPRFCRHGNPNVLTADRPTSRLSQGCAGQHALVQVAKFVGDVPALAVLSPPRGAGLSNARTSEVPGKKA